jgi:hypothetical protein
VIDFFSAGFAAGFGATGFAAMCFGGGGFFTGLAASACVEASV